MSITLPPIPLPSINTWPNTPEKLRARDIEVARVVLEAAANRADVMTRTDAHKEIRIAAAIRSLKVLHAE